MEFSSPSELVAHYRAVRLRLSAPLPVLRVDPIVMRPMCPILSCERIIVETCAQRDVSRREVISPKTRPIKIVARVRHEIMYLMAKELGFNFCRIGRALGGMHQMSVIDGIRAHCKHNNLPVPPSHPVGRPREVK